MTGEPLSNDIEDLVVPDQDNNDHEDKVDDKICEICTREPGDVTEDGRLASVLLYPRKAEKTKQRAEVSIVIFLVLFVFFLF